MRLCLIFTLLATALVDAQEPRRAFGLLPASEDAYRNYHIAGLAPTGILPTKASLEHLLPPPGQQGETQGSCTAWATTFALRTALQARLSQDWRPPSLPARQFSPAFVFNRAKAAEGAFNCTSGIYFATALGILQADGATTLDRFPYDPDRCDTQPTSAHLAAAKNYRIANWGKTADLSTDLFKSHLAAGDPVLVAINVYDPFYVGAETISSNVGAYRGYHAIILVGYDDSRKAFRLQNSWGQSWGEDGRAWISYNTLSEVVKEAYRVTPLLPSSAFELPSISSTGPVSSRRFGIVNDVSHPAFTTRIQDLFSSLGEKFVGLADDQKRYAVRVNAFESKDQALSLARSIVQGPSGLDAKVLPQVIQGKPLYSVVVASGLDSVEAAIVLHKAKREGFALATRVEAK